MMCFVMIYDVIYDLFLFVGYEISMARGAHRIDIFICVGFLTADKAKITQTNVDAFYKTLSKGIWESLWVNGVTNHISPHKT